MKTRIKKKNSVKYENEVKQYITKMRIKQRVNYENVKLTNI